MSTEITVEMVLKDILADESLELAHDQNSDPIALFKTKTKTICLPIESVLFKRFVERELYQKFKAPLYFSQTIVQICAAKGRFDGRLFHLEPRLTTIDDKIYYDLGLSVVEVTKDGWKICENSNLAFRSYPVMKSQVTPTTGGNLNWLLDLFQIQEDSDRALLLAWIVAGFVPEIAHPILAVHGQQGSAKTTLCKLIVDLIDPSHITDVHLGDVQQFLQAADHRWVLPLDNLSYIKQEYSDLLCKLVTGTGISKRALYTNNDDFFRFLRRVVIINGLTPSAEKADLLERCILMPLERIPDNKRRPEQEILKAFEKRKPELLGACFDLLVKAMRIKENLKPKELPRMADFALWGEAITQATGGIEDSFLAAYKINTERQNEEALDAKPVATAIRFYLRTHSQLSGALTDVHKIVIESAERSGIDRRILPRCPRSFGRALVEITPALTSQGYIVRRTRGKNRMVEILPPTTDRDNTLRNFLQSGIPSSASFPSLDDAENSGKIC